MSVKPLIKTEWPRRWLLAGLLAAATQAAHAERAFVGVLETDSYQSALYGATAFSRVADLPLAEELVQTFLAKNMLLPSASGIAVNETLRIVQTVDPTQPIGPDNPATVALIPMMDNGQTVTAELTAAYRAKRPQEIFTLFENPADTNLPSRVSTAIVGKHILVSTSRDALAWVWENRARLLGAPRQSIPGDFRILVNPSRLADVLGSKNEKASAVLNTDKLLRDFETLSFSLTLDGQALALCLRGMPRKGTAMDALVGTWQKPSDALWRSLPEDAFFASLAGHSDRSLWSAYLGTTRIQLLHPVADLAPSQSFTGEHASYLTATRDGKGLCLVQLEPVTNPAPVRAAIKKLHTASKQGDVVLTPKPMRLVAGLPVETYGIEMRPASDAPDGKPMAPSTLSTLLSLFLKKAVLETAVTDTQVITLIGPPGAIDALLPAPAAPPARMTIDRTIKVQDPALTDNLTLGANLSVVHLLHQIVAIIPDIRPEQLSRFPTGGDGATFGITASADHTVTASLRFQASEIAALQRINRDGREVLQELFFQMFAKQMIDAKQAPEQKPIRR